MPALTRQQTTACRWLLQRSDGHPEDQIRKHIGGLLDSLGDDIHAEFSYRTSAGPADIYLPRRRTIIETKAFGLADDSGKPQAGTSESPRQQLERYLHAEIRYELNSLPLDGQAGCPLDRYCHRRQGLARLALSPRSGRRRDSSRTQCSSQYC
ncbi:MAG: hypothetical protein OXH68_21925 [Gammaproteobacteria bacterium]|nr:hypothetical protein [Gammaproteobacteria bacterium]